MKKILFLRLFWAAALLEGLPAFAFLAAMRNRGGAWLVLLVVTSLAWLVLAVWGGATLFSTPRATAFFERAWAWLQTGSRLQALLACLAGLSLLAAELILFTFMFFPPGLRGVAIWLFCLSLQSWILLRLSFRNKLKADRGRLPALAHLDNKQRRVFLVMAVIGLVYFVLFIPTNLSGTANAGEFLVSGGDEYVIYPILTTMLTPGADLRTTLYRLIEYDDYHYGYPFYLLSAVAILPVRLIYGAGFAEQYRLNLFLLRQVISLLPIILSALIFTYLGTRLRSYTRAVFLFVLILSIPAVTQYGQHFWHPDGLAVLFVGLTFFFLERDQLKLGRDFYLAAMFCGLASAVRLVGFFFFLSIGVYLFAVWQARRGAARVITGGLVFILVMSGAILLTNPFLFDSGARGRMIATLGQKSIEMAHGYQEPDPEEVYRTGWAGWMPFFERDYAQRWFLAFLCLSILAGSLLRDRIFPILLASWTLVMGGYLVYFVAVKSFQYSLPLFIPLYSAVFMLPALVEERLAIPKRSEPGFWVTLAAWGAALIAAVQLVFHLAKLWG